MRLLRRVPDWSNASAKPTLYAGAVTTTRTLTAEIMIELGEPLDIAMQRIRAARPGAIETQAQENYLEQIGAVASGKP